MELSLELFVQGVKLAVSDKAVIDSIDMETVASVGPGPGVTQLLSLRDGEMHGCSSTLTFF